MTLRDAMQTLNGELDANGKPSEDSADIRMKRMEKRLGELRKERMYVGEVGFGPAIQGMVEADIRQQEEAIRKAVMSEAEQMAAGMTREEAVEKLGQILGIEE